MGDLSPNFSRREFACRCGCGVDAVSPNLIQALERMRAALNARQGGSTERGLTIRSGCRCPAWNTHEKGEADSAHLTDISKGEVCEAADLVAPGSRARYQLSRAAMEAGIKRIGKGSDFIHVDVDPVKDQEVEWLY